MENYFGGIYKYIFFESSLYINVNEKKRVNLLKSETILYNVLRKSKVNFKAQKGPKLQKPSPEGKLHLIPNLLRKPEYKN